MGLQKQSIVCELHELVGNSRSSMDACGIEIMHAMGQTLEGSNERCVPVACLLNGGIPAMLNAFPADAREWNWLASRGAP